jgi:NAD(P)-dependent dehydrogenase (short-subunit alcohol dehydrogenase family)
MINLTLFKKIIKKNRTTAVLEKADPKKWREHFFGLPPERWKRLSSQAFWITGAGTGYGRSIACALAAAGAQVFLTGRRIEKLQESIEEISSLFDVGTEKCYLIPADITREEEILKTFNKIKNLCSGINGLINNAAIPSKPGSRYPLRDDPVEYWDRIIATNVKAPWLLTRTIFPYMLTSGEVRVLFITSGAAWTDTLGLGMYNISKAALNSLGHSMAKEYAAAYPDADIQINTISPGEARTEMNQGSNISPYSIVSIVLLLLSHPKDGPNGRFFHSNGIHLQFCYTKPYERSL